MIKSMTAYACAELMQKDLNVGTEIRSYNSRYLDIVLRLPTGFSAVEEKIKHIIGEYVARGRVEARLVIKTMADSAVSFEVDLSKAEAYYAAAENLRHKLNLPNAVSLDHMLQVPGMIQAQENPPAIDEYWPVIEAALKQALAQLDAMRQKEGSFLKEDFSRRLAEMAQALDTIEAAAGELPALYRDRLQSRIEALTQGNVELDPVRLAQEAAFLADKSDIQEELVRARSHLSQFAALLSADEPAGRKLNFLLQELNREFNTMGSKVGQAGIAHCIVDLKAELEKIREQVQNIE